MSILWPLEGNSENGWSLCWEQRRYAASIRCQIALTFLKEEYKLLLELSPLSGAQMFASAFGTLMAPILKLFNQVLTQLITLMKKSLHKYNFLALSAYEGLLSLQRNWDDLLSRRGSDYVSEKNEPKDGLLSLRALCLRSFPEFLADLKMGAMSRGSDTSTKLTDFTTSVRSLFLTMYVSSRVSLYRPSPISIACPRY